MTEFLLDVIQLARDAVAETWDIVLFFVLILLLGWLYKIVKRGIW